MKRKFKLDVTHIIIFGIWVMISCMTGMMYHTSVYGSSNSKVVGVKAADDFVEKDSVEDIFKDKVIVGFGDSIMRGNGSNEISLTQQIAEKHNMRYQDFSRGGATMASKDRSERNLTLNMLEQVKKLISQVEYTDYILFNGGTNDILDIHRIEMGTITEDFDESRDISTYCGAFEEALSILKEEYPNAAIVYVRTHVMDRRDYADQLICGEEAIKICNKWGIEYADIFEESEMNTYLDRYRAYTKSSKKFPGGDMLHPTLEGYELFYIPYIEKAFVRAVNGD